MYEEHPATNSMTLYSGDGERKYLNSEERRRFYAALPVIRDATERAFAETIYWTGCRPSEALQLDIMRVNVDEAFLVFRTLKQHGQNKGKRFRIVPVPREFINLLDKLHDVLKTQQGQFGNQLRRLWTFGRQKGWKLIKTVMIKARVFGVRACGRGLRHSFGVHAILHGVPVTSLQKWMGHTSLKTTSIYLNIIGLEDRAIAKRMWG